MEYPTSEHSCDDYFIDSILVVALAKCFQPGEQHLPSDELFRRGFAPLDSYCDYCVDRLVSRSLVASEFRVPPNCSDGTQIIRCIRLLTDQSHAPDEQLKSRLDLIVSLFSESIDCLKCLLKLKAEIQVCEAIEVGEFYANVWGLTFQNTSFSNPKLTLMIHSENVEVVQSLILRTLKRLAKGFEHSNMETLNFDKFINDVYELYLRCKSRGIYIHGQSRPIQLKRSILAEMLEGDLSGIVT